MAFMNQLPSPICHLCHNSGDHSPHSQSVWLVPWQAVRSLILKNVRLCVLIYLGCLEGPAQACLDFGFSETALMGGFKEIRPSHLLPIWIWTYRNKGTKISVIIHIKKNTPKIVWKSCILMAPAFRKQKSAISKKWAN